MNFKKSFTLLLLIFSVGYSVFAQNEDYRSTVNLNVGYAGASAVFKFFSGVDADETISSPAFQANYDYGINHWFSVGAGLSWQKFALQYDDYTYVNENDEVVTEDFKNITHRTNLAFRALFHYANKGQVDLYSGFRIGVTNWNNKTASTDPDFEPIRANGNRLGFQVILFGVRGYFNDHIGINMELGAGAPHLVSGGLSYRF